MFIQNRKNVILLFLTVILAAPVIIHAAVMQSASYQIQSDSVNVGGARGTSASYIIEDTTGEVATGYSSSTSYDLQAGYQQMQETFISITQAPDITMPNMGGIGSVSSTGSTTWTVVTDNVAGYELSVRAASSSALQSVEGYSFDDYTPTGAAPDFAFSIPATTSAFAFTPEGVDINQAYQDNGSSCNIASGDTADACWGGFSTSDEQVAVSSSSNHPAGATTTLKVRAENGASHIQEAGTYTATLIITAVAL